LGSFGLINFTLLTFNVHLRPLLAYNPALQLGGIGGMKITATVTGYGPRPGKTHALVDVSVEFHRSNELASFHVRVPHGNNDDEAREAGIARAMDLARKIADQGLGSSPPMNP
jgi:hypothetical protein